MKKQTACLLFTLASGCASTIVPPAQLTDARAAFDKAREAPGAQLALVDVHNAEEALNCAEKAFKDDQENPRVIDLAYVAQRKAELAEVRGDAAKATQDQATAEKAITQTHADTAEQRGQELSDTRKELSDAQSQTKAALAELKTLKGRSVKESDRGTVITIAGSFLFRSNKAELMPTAKAQLEDIAQALSAAKGRKISIEGYTDATGPDKRNEVLSQKRAEAVMAFFIKNGLPADEMKAEGKGPKDPIADNASAEGRASNRRVEIIVQAEGKSTQGS